MTKKKKLSRGLHRRGDSIVAVFALNDGKIERRSLGDVSVDWAEEELARFRRQVREGNYEPRKPRQPRKPIAAAPKEITYTVGDLWTAYLRSYRLAGKKACWRQEAAWRHLAPRFAVMSPQNLTTAMLTDYQEARQKEGASAGTTNRETSALSAALYYAQSMTVEGGKPWLEHVPTFPHKLKEAPARKGFIVDKDYSTLAENAKPIWLRALIACAYTFGFRKGELLNLRCSQVDLLGRWIQLEEGTTKNDDGRKVKMTQEVFDRLCACVRGKNPDDFVFTREAGQRVADPRDDWYALSVASGLGKFIPAKRRNGEDYQKYVGRTLHDFRRSAIRNMDRRGVSQTVAMSVTGHRTVSVWRRYNIGDEEDLEQATAKIEAGREVLSHQAGGTGTSTKTDTSHSEAVSVPS